MSEWFTGEKHARSRIRSKPIDAAEIARRLGFRPSHKRVLDRYETHEWWLDTTDLVDSEDTRLHLDWMIDLLERLNPEIRRLQEEGATVEVWAFCGSHTVEEEECVEAGRLQGPVLA
jgi:Domain of unknown function (DUF4279)